MDWKNEDKEPTQSICYFKTTMEFPQPKHHNVQPYPRKNRAMGVKAKDIVFTKGDLFDKHPGNLRYHTIVRSFSEEFESAKRRSDKLRIVHEIIATVNRYGGRFVKYNSKLDQWEEISKRLVSTKIFEALEEGTRCLAFDQSH